jgi:transposase
MRAEVLVGPERRRRWTVEAKLAIVREAFAPGVRVADVARRRDVSRGQVYHWRAALREGRLSEDRHDVVGFVPVELPGLPSPAIHSVRTSPSAAEPIEIELNGGRRLKVPSSLPTAELRRLIRAVEGA